MGAAKQAPDEIISLPKGGGAVRGIGETFKPDPQTGTGNLTVPIAVPAGRHGLEPNIDLTYSTGNGNGPCGLGWTLSVPGICRKTSRGVPTYDDDADTFILSGSEDLVPAGAVAGVGTQYRPRTEGLFASIVHHRNLGSRQDYWEVTSRDGLVSTYGTPRSADSDGGASNWRDQAVIADSTDPSHIFAWKLTETRDPLGNRIVYEYGSDSGESNNHRWRQPQLRTIRYADYIAPDDMIRFLATVTFADEEREDAFSSYTAGFEIRTTRRYRSITTAVHTDVDQLVRRYELGYQSDPYNGVSLLTSVAVVGFDDAGAEHRDLPAVTIGYGQLEPTSRRFQPVTGADPPSVALSQPNCELVDLTGDGFPDVLQLDGVARYWRNLGDGRFDRPRPMASAPAGVALGAPGVKLLDADGDGRADLLVTTPTISGYFPLRFGPSWGGFHRYRNPPSFDLDDPQVRLIDLDGDGVTDALRAGNRLESSFANSRAGWSGPRPARSAGRDGPPRLSFADPRVRLADMTGDGLTDLVLVHDRAVEYWPNLGRGRWGDRLLMTAGPKLPYRLNPGRLLLGDVDGDGLADLVYADDNGLTIWFNRSGNAWSDPVRLPGVPAAGWHVRIADLLGVGTGGVLWSRDATASRRPSMYFLDLTGGVQPRLLCEVDNNIGAVTKVGYRPSTAYAIADWVRPETRWRTPLPLVVPVVSRVETIDKVSGGKLTTTYSYRHGYWDGSDRELRGFGYVEQTDSETFEEYHEPGLHPGRAFRDVDRRRFSAPTLTRTWFHLGPVETDDEDQWAELDLQAEYWAGDPHLLKQSQRVNRFLRGLSDPAGRLDRRARRDALRALRGRVLRSELYGLDGSARQDRPYTVTEHAYDLREESSAGALERPRVFAAFQVATRTTQWERGSDPMTRFAFTADHDAFGQARRETTVALPRRSTRCAQLAVAPIRDGAPRTLEPDETRVLATHRRTIFTEPDDNLEIHDRVAELRNFELVHRPLVHEQKPADVLALLEDQLRAATTVSSTFDRLDEAEVRLLAHVVHHYDGDPYRGRDDGMVGPYGLLTRSEMLVFRDGEGMENTLGQAYGEWVPEQLGGPHSLPNGAPPAFGTNLGYRHEPVLPADTHHFAGWYVDTTRNAYDVQLSTAADPLPGRGLILGVQDALGHETRITPEKYGLFPAIVRDAVGLEVNASYNYRAGRPNVVVDPNGNATEYRYHPLGLLATVTPKGREGEGGSDDRPGISYTYDLTAYARSCQPIFVHATARVWHASDVAAGIVTDDIAEDIIETREYTDGFGRLVQKRAQADDLTFGHLGDDVGLLVTDMGNARAAIPGKALSLAVVTRDTRRVVVSGWQIYDNKGRIVESYDPHFDRGWEFRPESEARHGKPVATHYDPRGRVFKVVNPDGSQRLTVFGFPSDLTAPEDTEPTPWVITSYDENDLGSDSIDPSGTPLRQRAPASHAFTPTATVIDALGRSLCDIACAGTSPDADWHATQAVYDICGNVVTVVDELGRTAFTHRYDLLNRHLRVDSIDAGRHITVLDAVGNSVVEHDLRGCWTVRAYDLLNRLMAVSACEDTGAQLTLRERLTYGDSGQIDQPSSQRQAARRHNLLGRLWHHLDEAGLFVIEAYDFTGNVIRQVRRVVSDASIAAAEPKGWTANWDAPDALDALEPTGYRTTTRYDAVRRAVSITAPTSVAGEPDRVIAPSYNPSGSLRSVTVDGVPYIRLLVHNARGQRVFAAYGNGNRNGSGPGPVTRYAYDPETFRIIRQRTEQMLPSSNGVWTASSKRPLQDLTYTYDLVGNVETIEDRTHGCGVAGSREGRDSLTSTYTYDAHYRLTSATGRACQDITKSRGLSDSPVCGSFPAAPNQANAPYLTAGYRETFSYDPVGNLLDMHHSVTTGPTRGTWHRTFGISDLSFGEWLNASSNRLTSLRDAGGPIATLTYDNAGNLASHTASRQFIWDHAGRMVGFRTSSGVHASISARYLYGADGNRVKKWVRKSESAGLDESTVYLGGIVEHHVWSRNGGGRNAHLHIMDGERRVAMVRHGPAHPADPGPASRYEFVDHLGNSVLTTDESGNWAIREEYFPYGETSFGSFAHKRYRFTSQERDEESGLGWHGLRQYAAELGRWISPDPAGGAPGSGAYTYVRNNPVNAVDPSGLAPEGPEKQVAVNSNVGKQTKTQQLQIVGARGNVVGAEEVTTRAGAGGSRLDAVTATAEGKGVRSLESTSLSTGKAGGAYRSGEGKLNLDAIRARIEGKVRQVLKHTESLNDMTAGAKETILSKFEKLPTRENLLITVRGASDAEVVSIRQIAKDIFTKLESKVRPGIGVISEHLTSGLKSLASAVPLVAVDIAHERAEERAGAERADQRWPTAEVIERQRRSGYEFTPQEGRPSWTYDPGPGARLNNILYNVLKMITDPTFVPRMGGLMPSDPFGGGAGEHLYDPFRNLT